MKKYFFTIIVLLSFYPLATAAADIFYSPLSLDVYQFDSFVSTVMVDSEEAINAIAAEVLWNPDLVTLAGINTGGSIFDLWVNLPKVNQSGKIRLVAGATKPFVGKNGKVVDLIFQVKKETGEVSLSFTADSKLIKADGLASEAELKFFNGIYTILARPDNLIQLSSVVMPDENVWYNTNIFAVHWPPQAGYIYSYLLTLDPTQLPDQEPEDILFDVKYEGLADGIYYFKLLAKTPAGKWLPVIGRRVMIDMTKPRPIELDVIGKDIGFGLSQVLVFSASDGGSGISHYEIREINEDYRPAVSPYSYQVKLLGRQVLVKAVDNAGNFVVQEAFIPGLVDIWRPFIWLGVAVFIILLLFIYFYVRQKKNK